MNRFPRLAAAIVLIAASQVFAAKIIPTTPRGPAGPQRLISVIENGPIVTLHLNDGSTVDVPRANLKIKDDTHAGVARQQHNKRAPMSVAQLSQMNAAPAVVMLSYKHGMVKRAKVHVFANEAALNTFLMKRTEKKESQR